MAEQYCNRTLEGFLQLARYRETFFYSLCVSNFAFSLVTSLGNILVIRALLKASSIPANVKKVFLSLAFSDLGVGLVSQLMAGIIYAAILKTALKGDYNLTSLCPTVLNLNCYLLFFLCAASLLTLSTIAVDRLLAVSLHLRYQELVTSKGVNIVLISIWLTSFITALIYIFLPKSNEMVAAVILLVGYFLTTVAYVRVYKVVKYHQNQIYSQNQLQNAQIREALRERKSAYNALFVYFVFLVCYLPYLPSTILYLTNTSEISFLIAKYAALFLICLNSSLNLIVYCWRFREIRQIVKSTMKKILRLDENMT